MHFAYELPSWWQRTVPELLRHLQSSDFDALLLARWIAQSLVLALLIFAADYLFGAGLLLTLSRRFNLRLSVPLRFATSLALGNGVSGLLVFLLGTVRLLTADSVTAVVFASGLAGFEMLRRQQGFAWARAPFQLKPSALAIALLSLFLPVIALQQLDLQMPVVEGDSTLYHMAAARWYAQHHRLAYHPGIRFNAQPQQTVLVYLRQWLVTGDETQIKLLNWEYLAILCAALRGGLGLLGAGRLFPAALLLVLSSPVFCWITKMEMADLGLTAYLTLGVVLLIVARHGQRAHLALAGLMLGFAAASKLQGMVIIAGFAVSWFCAVGLRRPREAVALAAGIALPGIGWWIRSLLYTGSPAYPFFSGNPEAKGLLAASLRYGFGHDALALLALPWRMITESSYIFADPYIFGIPLLVLLLTGLAALLHARGRLNWRIAILLGGFLFYFAFWFMTGQVMRYLASVLPVMALLFAAALRALHCRRTRWWAIAPLVPVALLAAATPSRTLIYALAPPVTLQQREVVQAAMLPQYRAARSLNRLARPRQRVYLWFCEDARFHVNATSYGDWFGAYNYVWLGQQGTTTGQMVQRLRGAGFQYILVDRDHSRRDGTLYPSEFQQTSFVADEGDSAGARLVIREGRYRVFKLD